MEEFALFLSSINEYEEAIEQFEKYGYEIDHDWNESILKNELIIWNHNSYILLNKSIQLHNHDGEFPVFIDIKDINLEQFSNAI